MQSVETIFCKARAPALYLGFHSECIAQGLSTDTRPEVRNSGVRTLFAVVASQGTRLSHSAWEECLWQMLFPLLRSVHHTAATSSREEACFPSFQTYIAKYPMQRHEGMSHYSAC